MKLKLQKLRALSESDQCDLNKLEAAGKEEFEDDTDLICD